MYNGHPFWSATWNEAWAKEVIESSVLYIPRKTPPFLNLKTSVVSTLPSSPLKTIETVPGLLMTWMGEVLNFDSQKRLSTDCIPCPLRDTDHRKRDDRWWLGSSNQGPIVEYSCTRSARGRRFRRGCYGWFHWATATSASAWTPRRAAHRAWSWRTWCRRCASKLPRRRRWSLDRWSDRGTAVPSRSTKPQLSRMGRSTLTWWTARWLLEATKKRFYQLKINKLKIILHTSCHLVTVPVNKYFELIFFGYLAFSLCLHINHWLGNLNARSSRVCWK